MNNYHVLYFSSGYSSVHRQIIDAINQFNIVKPCLYTIHSTKSIFEHPEDALFFSNRGKTRGPIGWKKRLDSTVDYIENNIDWSEVDVLHSHLLYTDGYICRRLSELHKIPYIVTVRNTDINVKYLKLPWIRKEMIRTVRDTSAIIYLNESYKDMLLKRIPISLREEAISKSVVIPNGVDDFWHDNRYIRNQSIKNNIIHLLTVGRVEKNKNQVIVKKAAEELRKQGYVVQYTIVGDCCDVVMKEELEKEDWIEIIPFQPKEKLIYYYRKADIYVMPSITETFGLVYVEAMTQGLPLIYSQGQGFDRQFKEGEVGYHINPMKPEAIVESIKNIMKRYLEISERCTRYSGQFNWTHIGTMFQKVYEKNIYGNNNFV